MGPNPPNENENDSHRPGSAATGVYHVDFILRKSEEPRTAPVEHLRPRRNSDVAVRKALDGRGLARARAEGHRAAEVSQPDTKVPGVVFATLGGARQSALTGAHWR